MEPRRIAIKDLVLSPDQSRKTYSERGIAEMAASLSEIGQLEPILVRPSRMKGRYEIVAGQRRWLAAERVGWADLDAMVTGPGDPAHKNPALASAHENLIREDLSTKDKIDVVTAAYRKYGSLTATIDATGLPERLVRAFVRYERLPPLLQAEVTTDRVDIRAALRAVDALPEDAPPEDVLELAKEMTGKSRADQAELVGLARSEGVTTALETAREGPLTKTLSAAVPIEVADALAAKARDDKATTEAVLAEILARDLRATGYLTGPVRRSSRPNMARPRR